jgi:hypothetical protein
VVRITAFKIADGYVEVSGRLDEASFRRAAKDAGERAGRDASGHFTTAFGRGLTRDRERSRHGLFSFLRMLLTPDRARIGALLHPLESAISIPLVGLIAAGIVATGAGAIAAAISSAVLLGIGGAVVGGAAALLGEKLKGPFERATDTIVSTLRRAAAPLQNEFVQAFRDIALLTKNLEGQFTAIFKAAEPLIPLLVTIFGEFAKELLPTIGQIMPFIVDSFEILAARTPEIADAMSKLLKAMADEETLTAFNTLLSGLIGTINLLAGAFRSLTRSFNNDVETFKEGKEKLGGIIGGIKKLLDKIPGKKVLRFLFEPGLAFRTIMRVTGFIKAIPKVWSTYMRFLGGGGAIGWAIRVANFIRRIPGSWLTKIRVIANTGPIRSFIGWLRRIPRNVTTTVTSVTRNIVQSIFQTVNPFANAHGGIIGAQGLATGGVSGARQVLVGEQGPELVDLPFGSRVRSNGDTRRELASGGGGADQGPIVIQLRIGNRELGEVIVDPLRKAVRSRGGNVQAVLGR